MFLFRVLHGEGQKKRHIRHVQIQDAIFFGSCTSISSEKATSSRGSYMGEKRFQMIPRHRQTVCKIRWCGLMTWHIKHVLLSLPFSGVVSTAGSTIDPM